MLMDGWKNLCLGCKETINLSNKSCAKMWNFVDEFLEKFNMQVNEEISQVGPNKLRIAEVEENKYSSK
jgi:hypothetical protein